MGLILLSAMARFAFFPIPLIASSPLWQLVPVAKPFQPNDRGIELDILGLKGRTQTVVTFMKNS
jgi:hypothetical protein